MVRIAVLLGILISAAACGGASTAPENSGGATSESEGAVSDGASAQSEGSGETENDTPPVDQAENSAAPADEQAPAAGEGDEETATAETSATAETAQPEEEGAPPSDDLQSYVGAKAYTPEYRVVTENMDAVKQCYLDGIRVDPDIRGTVKVRFTVNKAGKVIKASAVINELNEQVGACVVSTIKKLKFPKRAQKRTVEYPFNFFPAP